MSKANSLRFLLLAFLIIQMPLVAGNKVNQHNGEHAPWFQTKNFLVPFSSFKSIGNFIREYPSLSLFGLSALTGYQLYGDEIKSYMHTNRDQLFGASMLTFLTAYITKDFWLQYLPDEEQELLEDMLSDDDQGIYNFTKTPVRVVRPGEIKITFKDVAGLQTAKEDLQDIVMFLEDSQRFEKIGAKIPKGILLHGSPGNGKTLLARAMAGEVNCHFLYVNASQFEEAFVGVGAARMRYLFSIAKEFAPCIIFIDELDSVGRKRLANQFSGETGQTLNQLLAEMDGFEQQKNPVVIIGATNRPDVLDSALTRPGRFDRKIEITSPYVHDRYEILQLHLAKVQTEDNLDVYKIARGTPGYSGADLAHLVNEGAIIALREGADKVSMLHLDRARDYINLGRETKGMNITEKEYWQTAVHEAGHALAHVLQKDATPLHKVTITPRGKALGLTFGMSEEKYSCFEHEMKARIVVALSGSVAEELMFGGRGAGASMDLKMARDLATKMVMVYGMTEEFKDVTFEEYIDAQVHLPEEIATKLQKEVTRIIHECRQIAVDLLSSHKQELSTLIDMLVEKGTVFGSDVYQLCGVEEPNIEYVLA